MSAADMTPLEISNRPRFQQLLMQWSHLEDREAADRLLPEMTELARREGVA